MDKELVNKLNNYSNPYVALAQTIDITNPQGEALENLLTFLIQTSKSDINEPFFSVEAEHDYIGSEFTRCYSIKMSNIIEVFGKINYETDYRWHTNNPTKIFNLLNKAGLNFTTETTSWLIPSTNFDDFFNLIRSREDFFNKIDEFSVQKKTLDPVFGVSNVEEERNICLIGHAYKQMSQDDFEKRVIKHKTLHNAVASSDDELIKFLIEECKINPNIKDEDLETPIFYCCSPNTLKVLNQYDINWFSKNILGKDCISSFTKLRDKDSTKEMVEFAQKRMSETIKMKKEDDVSPEYIKQRIKQTLLEMVQTDKTKKELEDFIKKNKITSFSDIYDEEGNSLAQICLKKHNWARYEIFKNSYPLEYVNKNGIGCLETMFLIQRVSYADKASAIFNDLFKNEVHKKNGNFSFNLIKDAFKDSKPLNVPNWYLNSSGGKNKYPFAKNLIGEEFANKFAEEYEYKPANSYSYSFNYYNYEDESKALKSVAYLLLTHTSLYGKNIDISLLPVTDMFTENKSYHSDEMEYQVNKMDLFNFIAIIETIDENKHLHVFDYSKLWDKFEQGAVEHLIKDYHSRKNNNISTFIENNKDLMNLLMDRNSELFKSMINDEFIENMKQDRELSVKLSYSSLSSKVKGQDGKINKTNKI